MKGIYRIEMAAYGGKEFYVLATSVEDAINIFKESILPNWQFVSIDSVHSIKYLGNYTERNEKNTR